MKIALTTILILLIAASATSAECRYPYREIGSGCCIDRNNNSVCDIDDSVKCAPPLKLINHFCCPDANNDGVCELMVPNATKSHNDSFSLIIPPEDRERPPTPTQSTATTTAPTTTTATATTITSTSTTNKPTTTTIKTTTTLSTPPATVKQPTTTTTDKRIKPVTTTTTTLKKSYTTSESQADIGQWLVKSGYLPPIALLLAAVLAVAFVYKIGKNAEDEDSSE